MDFFILGGSLLLAGVALLPHFHIIDSKGIRIYYIFLLKEEFLWSDIDSVEINYEATHRRYIPYIFDTFSICGCSDGPDLFFMRSEISRTRRARWLIEKHIGRKIEGYASDYVKGFLCKTFAKIKSHLPARKRRAGKN